MLLGFLSVVVMLLVAWAVWRRGVLAAFALCCNVLLAGLVAFNFFEPIADQFDAMLARSALHGLEDGFCLMMLFCLTLACLCWTAYLLVPTKLELPRVVQQGGAVLFGLTAGYLVSGFLLCVMQTLPVGAHFLGFEARIDPQAPARMRRVLPPDRVWLALMHRTSLDSLSWDTDSSFDPDGSFEWRYARERRGEE